MVKYAVINKLQRELNLKRKHSVVVMANEVYEKAAAENKTPLPKDNQNKSKHHKRIKKTEKTYLKDKNHEIIPNMSINWFNKDI